jgi:hypothetical protein
VLALRPAAKRHNQKHTSADLEEQVAADKQPGPISEGVGDRHRHEQTGEHQADERQAHDQRIRIQPVRPPRDHVPGVENRERDDHRLGAHTSSKSKSSVVTGRGSRHATHPLARLVLDLDVRGHGRPLVERLDPSASR